MHGSRCATVLTALTILGTAVQAQDSASTEVRVVPTHQPRPGGSNGSNEREKAKDAIRRAIRLQIAKGIKAHGHSFEGPASIPQALMDSIQWKRLVGLGEGTHGTSELVTMRGNIILALAEKEKVVVFVEDQTATFAPINRWIHGDKDEADLPGLMSGLFGTTNIGEFGAFLKKVRGFNAQHPKGRDIEIYGVDMQISTSPASNPLPALRSWLAGNGLALDAELAIADKYIQDTTAGVEITSLQMAQIKGAIAKIFGAVEGADHALPGWAETKVAANNLERYAEFDQTLQDNFKTVHINAQGDMPSVAIVMGTRDGAMAENIKTLMDARLPVGSGKGVFWAHNGHISRLSYLNSQDWNGKPAAWANAGSILNLWLGDAYAPVAFMTGAGTFRTKVVDEKGTLSAWQPAQAPPAPADCLNVIARNAFPKPVFFLTQEVPGLDQVLPEFGIGVPYYPDRPETNFVLSVPGMAYYAVVSFPLTTSTGPMK